MRGGERMSEAAVYGRVCWFWLRCPPRLELRDGEDSFLVGESDLRPDLAAAFGES